jgi:hypothetical protein
MVAAVAHSLRRVQVVQEIEAAAAQAADAMVVVDPEIAQLMQVVRATEMVAKANLEVATVSLAVAVEAILVVVVVALLREAQQVEAAVVILVG